MKGRLYVIGAHSYIYQGLSTDRRKRVECLPPFLDFPRNKFKQAMHFLLVGRIPLPGFILNVCFPRQALSRLLQATKDDRILLYECTNPRTLKALKYLLPGETTCYVYYCNPVHTTFRHPEKTLKDIARMGFKLSSFDPYEAKKYGLDYAGQYLRYPDCPPVSSTTTDCFFCGLAKNRREELERLKRQLERNGIKCQFIIPQKAEEGISYSEYLRLLNQSRCLIDVNQKNQTGLTRRPLEALFYGKKLITNNQTIDQYDFYDPENIFILGKDDPDRLKDFIGSPAKEVPRPIKDRYDINGWIDQFLHS